MKKKVDSRRDKDSYQYRIVIQGELNDSWRSWFGDVSIETVIPNLNPRQTIIRSERLDQAALRGLLNKIWDLNLLLISVNRQEIGAYHE
ncbi:MAG: hypothetical protein JSV42_04410 [Chloroflexota bacterium]|nr:MAG: hypothetical protein JSV42_04410 [Chloroflexota bacterium]